MFFKNLGIIVSAVLALVLFTAPKTTLAEPVIDGKVKLAFVDDGFLVLANDTGTIKKTTIRCGNPSISASGNIIAYIDLVLLPDFKAKYTYNNTKIGQTWVAKGISTLDVRTGIKTKITQSGDFASISPNEKFIAFQGEDGKIKTIDIKTHSVSSYQKGIGPVWFDNQTIAFQDNGVFWKADIGKKPVLFLRFSPIPVSDCDTEDEMIDWLAEGDTIYLQSDLKLCGNGLVSFALCEMWGLKTTYYAVIANKQKVIESIKLAEQVGNNDVAIPIGEQLAISQNTRTAIFNDCPDIWKNDQLYFANYSRASAPEIRAFGNITNLDDIACTNGRFYCSTFPARNLKPQISSDKVYYLGRNALDPAKLKMMNLDPTIADLDAIWEISSDGKTMTKISGGHSLAVRN